MIITPPAAWLTSCAADVDLLSAELAGFALILAEDRAQVGSPSESSDTGTLKKLEPAATMQLMPSGLS
ncbi:hypothetical protein RA28_16445 [Ruegeria sp. ANG-S4]|nr:hypothetical protein RA28_16445 [Ruegeria sp. ANG-S4]